MSEVLVKDEKQALQRIKNLGGIGAILTCLNFIPYSGILLLIAGFVFLIVAFYQASQLSQDKRIFHRYITAVAIGWIGLFALAILGVILFLPFMRHSANFDNSAIIRVAVFLLFWLGVMITGAYFQAQSYKLMAENFGVVYFKWAGNLLLWGAVTAILLVGFVLIFLSVIFLIIAFFSLPDKMPPEQNSQAIIKESDKGGQGQ